MKAAPKRVCVIGAGANGLATLKVLAQTDQVQSGQWTLVAFEERDNVGGIWYHPLFISCFFFSSLMLGTLLLPLEIPRYRRYMIRYTRTYHTV
jgi:cation diffusion facilitator CzcD-associated flavoprotein CzcO